MDWGADLEAVTRNKRPLHHHRDWRYVFLVEYRFEYVLTRLSVPTGCITGTGVYLKKQKPTIKVVG